MEQKLVLVIVGLCIVAGIVVGGNFAHHAASRPTKIALPPVTYRWVTAADREYLKHTYQDEILNHLTGDYLIASCLEGLCLDFTTGHYLNGELTSLTLESGEQIAKDRFDVWTFPEPYPALGFNEAFDHWLADNQEKIADYLTAKDAR